MLDDTLHKYIMTKLIWLVLYVVLAIVLTHVLMYDSGRQMLSHYLRGHC
jgi:hypothetical protein